ncbi:MAG: hypothetical protein CMJ27_11145 [Phycisphaerae bacterium]|nr:hypothetical protein [Phycisphaerae bacterium]OUX00622.1 MAG: hypothetical protein CBD91_06315 [Phycisphaeraceae bacterium TMED231]
MSNSHRMIITSFLTAGTLVMQGCSFDANDFTGRWEGPCVGMNSLGTIGVDPTKGSDSVQTLELVADAAGRLRGSIAWRADSGHDHEQQVVSSDSEDVIGLADLADGSFVLVETEESGTLVGRILSGGRVELLRTQPGIRPVVTASTLERIDD